MKALFILFLSLFFINISNAQDPQLFENDWYLQKIIIDNNDYYPPNIIGEQINGRIYFFDEFDVININFCGSIEGLINYEVDDDLFTLDDYPSITIGDCSSSENNSFSLMYFTVYFSNGSDIAFNPFNYIIENDTDNLRLTIENNNGDKAIYGNTLLSTHEVRLEDFNITPNPASNLINIKYTNKLNINKVLVYDTIGRLVLEQSNPNNQIDISNLSSGLLFVQIETNNGTITKKVIKD